LWTILLPIQSQVFALIIHADGSRLTTTMVLDATGHARKLVEFDAKFDPGYQVTMASSTICNNSTARVLRGAPCGVHCDECRHGCESEASITSVSPCDQVSVVDGHPSAADESEAAP